MRRVWVRVRVTIELTLWRVSNGVWACVLALLVEDRTSTLQQIR